MTGKLEDETAKGFGVQNAEDRRPPTSKRNSALRFAATDANPEEFAVFYRARQTPFLRTTKQIPPKAP